MSESYQHDRDDDEKQRLLAAPSSSTSSSATPSAASSSSGAPCSISSSTTLPLSPPPTSTSLRLTLIKSGEQRILVNAEPDWTLERLRSFAIAPNELDNPDMMISILYIGRKLVGLKQTLKELGIKSDTSIHFIIHANPAVAAASSSSYQNDPSRADDADMWVADMPYDYRPLALAEQQGTWTEFVLGAMIGLLLGLLSVIFFLQPNLSRRCRMGICVGMSFNFAFGITRYVMMQQEEQQGLHHHPHRRDDTATLPTDQLKPPE